MLKTWCQRCLRPRGWVYRKFDAPNSLKNPPCPFEKKFFPLNPPHPNTDPVPTPTPPRLSPSKDIRKIPMSSFYNVVFTKAGKQQFKELEAQASYALA